jgi:hypothetical protein
MLIKEVKDSVTYCIRCGSTLIWDDAGRPKVLKLGNNKLVHCLERGCNLIWTNIPYEASEALNPDMIRLALMQSGVPSEDATSAAVNLAISNTNTPVV